MRKEILFNQVKWLRLRILLISACLIFIGNYLSAQALGDYRSNTNGFSLWINTSIWETWDGSAWVGATDYPGQNTGTGVVTIQDGSSLLLTVNPAFPMGSLIIQEGVEYTDLFIFNGITLNVTGAVEIRGANLLASAYKQIAMTGGNAQLNCASFTIIASENPLNFTRLTFNDGGIVNITGNINMGSPTPQGAYIAFNGAGGTLNVGGNIVGGQITTGSGTINFTGSGTQTSTAATVPPNTLANLGMTNGSTLQLGANLTLTGTLTLTNGKINTGTNILFLNSLTPNLQISGGSSTSYVYSTGAGRLSRTNLISGNNFTYPIGTATHYMPVIVNSVGANSFAMSVFSPATTNGAEGGTQFANKSSMVDAVWNIDRTEGTTNATITIQWADALEGSNFASFSNSQIGVSRFSGSWLPAVANSADNAANTVTATFNTFSPFGVGEISVALPVKFGSIKAYEKQNGIQLDWKVYSENKVKNYEVERSADARSFTPVGSLPALYNNTSDGDYGFFDANPLPGTSYYRIKNNDLDGKSAYSIIMRVNRNKTIKGLSLYPNPVVSGIVLLQGSDLGRGNYKINIFAANGQEIYKQQIIHNGGTISHTIELPSTISKGVYMLSVKDEYGNIILKEKLVKQ